MRRKDHRSVDEFQKAISAAVAANNPIDEILAPYAGTDSEGFTELIVENSRKIKELQDRNPMSRGTAFGRYTRVLALGKGDPQRGIYEARKNWQDVGDDAVVKSMEKALQAGTPSGGGSLIPTSVSSDFINYLTEANVFLANSRNTPMPNGNLTIRRSTSGATASYTGESTNVSSSQGVTGELSLSFKKLISIVPVSNSLLRFSGQLADEWVRDDLRTVMSKKLDDTAFFSNGESGKPRGLVNLLHADNSSAQTGTSLANRITDFKLILDAALGSNAEGPFVWGMSHSLYHDLLLKVGSTEDATRTFADELAAGRLFGYKVVRSNRFVAAGNADSRGDLFFWSVPDFLNGMATDLQIDALDGVAYYDGSSVVSGVSRDETVIRAVMEHDVQLRHNKAGYNLTGVTV